MKCSIALATLAALIAGASQTCAATIYAYQFTAQQVSYTNDGSVNSIADTAASFQTLTGTLFVSDDVQFDTGDPTFQLYAPWRLSVDQLPGVSNFVPGGPPVLATLLDVGAQPYSTLLMDGDAASGGTDLLSSVPTALEILSDPGTTYDAYDVTFTDSSGSALSGSAFPQSLDLADWDSAEFSIFAWQGMIGSGPDDRVVFEFTSLGMAAVPLPAGAWLLLAGLAALGIARRRR